MIQMKRQCNQAGKTQINFVAIFIFIAVVVGVFSAIKFAPPYYTNRNFEGFLNMQARNSYEWNNELIEKNIREYTEQNGIVLERGEWSVYRTDTQIFIKVRYSKVIEIPFGLSRAIRFEHNIKQEIKPLAQL